MHRRFRPGWAAAVALAVLAAAAPAQDADVSKAIATLKGVTKEGAANDAAGPAWKAVVDAGAAALIPTLKAVDDANPTAANWLLTAAGAIAEKHRKDKGTFTPELDTIPMDETYAPSARRFAYELAVLQTPGLANTLLPKLLDSPEPNLRREAIAHGMKLASVAASGSGEAEKAAYHRLFALTRDKDQAEELAKKLEGLKVPVSVTEHFAFLTHFRVAGPFASERGKALTLSYPPETNPDPEAEYAGKAGAKVTWVPLDTSHRYGVLDLNDKVGRLKDACVYALAVVHAVKETPAEVRVGSPNAVAIFLNGKKLFGREEYHHGDLLDYHVGRGVLRAGENRVVVKVCQNNQTDSWAQRWQFQARVCDATGGAIPGVTQVVAGRRVPLGRTEPEGKK